MSEQRYRFEEMSELEQEIAQEMMEYEEYMMRQAFANPLLPNNQSKEI